MGFGLLQCPDAGIDNRRRRVKIRLADFHVNNIVSLRLQGFGLGQNIHDMKRRYRLCPFADWPAHVSPLKIYGLSFWVTAITSAEF
jgi:hypothetical protein